MNPSVLTVVHAALGSLRLLEGIHTILGGFFKVSLSETWIGFGRFVICFSMLNPPRFTLTVHSAQTGSAAFERRVEVLHSIQNRNSENRPRPLTQHESISTNWKSIGTWS